ncbi:MAG: hypothetical protein WD226_09520 [Planctomycetota bacterium]
MLLGLAGLIALTAVAIVRPVRRVAPMRPPSVADLVDWRASLRERIPVEQVPPSDRAVAQAPVVAATPEDARDDVVSD